MRKKRSNKKKTSKALRIFFNIVGIIAIVIMLVFCVYIYKLDMLPSKYLYILFIVLGGLYLLLSIFTFPKRIKKGYKIFSCIIFIVFSFVFAYGIKYVDKTISFIDKVNDNLMQQEEYQIKCLSKSNISKEKINNKKIGIFKNSNYEKIIEKLNKKYKLEIVDYSDATKMFEDLEDGKIDLVIASDNVYGLLSTELNYMNLELSKVDSIMVPIDTKGDIVKIVDVTNTPFNIFIAGGDAFGDINKVMNTDVNMVVSIDAKNHKILLTSIPRDYYVNLAGMGDNVYDKLTHAGYYGVQESVKTVEKLLDTDINYYAKVNFSTIEKLVDAIGGIEVDSDYTFNFEDPGNNMYYSYVKGKNYLNGRKALGFARERESFKDGDIQRVKDQQKVISAIINKMTSSKTLINKYTDILDAISESLSTNLDNRSISRLVKMQLNDMRGWTVESQNLVGTDYSSTHCYSIPNINLYVMKQDDESVKNARTKIKEFLNK